MRLPFPALFATVLGTSLMGWTVSNGTAIPGTDSEASFPSFECVQAAACTATDSQTLTHWLGRTPSGNLYLVTQAACTDARRCNTWFVERTARGMGATLNVEGRFQLVRNGKRVPDVQTWREVSENEIVKTRYTWESGTYRQAETRTVYRVDGVECGTAAECNDLAIRAHQQHRTDQALRIWETVHKISWI
jgi:hypothetical protein